MPSGASTGRFEAVELRDGGERYGGKGVRKAVGHVNGEIADALYWHEAYDQRSVDLALVDLDGTADKSRLGANAILGCSLAVARAGPPTTGRAALPLPRGSRRAHLAGADDERIERRRALGQQRRLPGVHGRPGRCRLICRGGAVGRRDLPRPARVLRTRRLSGSVGDEGGFAPDLESNEHALEILVDAIKAAGRVPGAEVALALDPASSELWRDGRYVLEGEGRTLSSDELVAYWVELVNRYPIISIEDGMGEQDLPGWVAHTSALGDRIQIVGDDVFVTSAERLERGIGAGVVNAILVKVNQVGTLSETLATVATATRASYRAVISHRSGETEDTFVADLAVATNCGQIKTGAPARSERVAKYNRLLRIEEQLAGSAEYPGEAAFARPHRGRP